MLWKVGGNFETVAVTCETNWKECVIAIANYLWCEVVFDVVDYVAKEGIIWILAITIASAIFIHIKYHKNIHAENIMLDKRILSKMGYKIQDLELKVNVLTYKMQYGTWPLPHQIYNLNSKKMQKIRMTLSSPSNQKNWMKHMPLKYIKNPMQNNMYAPYSNTVSSSVKLTNLFDVTRKCNPYYIQRSKLLTYCSSIEASKSTSDHSVNTNSWPSTHSRNVNAKVNFFQSKDYMLQWQNIHFLPLSSDEINYQSSRTQNGACMTYSRNAKYDPCQKFTNTIYKCKSFLKELEYNNKCLHSLSSETSKVSSSKAAYEVKQSDLFTKKKESSCGVYVVTKEKEINEIKCVKKNKTIKDAEEIYQSNVNISDAAVLTRKNSAFSRKLAPILPIIHPTHNIQSSRETLYEVRKKLQSLHNILRTYENMNRCLKKQKSTDQIGEIDAFVSIGSKIENVDKKNADTICNVDSEENLRRSQYIGCSEKSLSSLAEHLSNTFKTYQCSNVTSQNSHFEKFNQHNAEQKSIGTSNFPMFMTTGAVDFRHNLHFYSAMLQISKNYEDKYKENVCGQDFLNYNRSHELRPKSESCPEINEHVTKTNTLFNLRGKISDIVSKKICYILSSKSFKDKNNQIQNKTSSMKKFAIKKFSDIFDGKQYKKDMIRSQNKMSNNSGKDEKSTTLLLQEALHFKKALLAQVQLRKSNIKENNVADESLPKSNNNNFPSMIIDIKTEESITNDSHNKINEHYIYLEIKQRCDLFPQSLHKVNTFAHRESKRDTENFKILSEHIPETPSEYFSITDLAIHNNVEVRNISLKSPVYEKIVSIIIPVNVKRQSEINTNAKLMETVLEDIQIHVNSRKNAENLRKNATGDNIDGNVMNKRSSTILKLEDFILEHIKNIRDYMDILIKSQNKAICRARKALHCQNKSDAFQRSNEANHVILHNQLILPSNCDSINQVADSLKNLSDLLINTRSIYKQEIVIGDNILKHCSDMYLKKNPEIFAFITPIKNEFSNENDTRQLEVGTELKRKEIDLSYPAILKYSCKNDSKSICKITDLNISCCEEYVISNKNYTENGKINKRIIDDINADFQECRKQTQIIEDKSSTISYFPFDVAKNEAKIVPIACEEKNRMTKCNCNSISHNNSCFINERIINDMKTDNASSKFMSNMEHSNIKSDIQKEIKQDIIKRQIFIDKYTDANVLMLNKFPSNIEYSNLTTFIDSNLLNKLGHEYSINAKTTLQRNKITYDSDTSPFFSLNQENKTLNTNNNSLNNLKENNETSKNIAYLSSETGRYSKKYLLQIYPRIKSKSDISLLTGKNKNLNINFYSKRSYSVLMCHDILEHIHRISHQPYAKLYNDKHKYIEIKSRPTIHSKSIIPLQKASVKSCIPILKNRLISTLRIKHQEHARSPTRSPLTMLWKKNNYIKNHVIDEKIVRRDNISINKHLCVEKEALFNLIKLNMEEDISTKKVEELNTIYRNNDITSNKNSKNVSNIRNAEFLMIDKRISDKRYIYSSKSDTKLMEYIENTAPEKIVIISMANDNLRKKYLTNSFILKTENVCSDLLMYKNKLWTITIKKEEKEVMAKPSITEICTSTSDLH